jgi:hypothetical protein
MCKLLPRLRDVLHDRNRAASLSLPGNRQWRFQTLGSTIPVETSHNITVASIEPTARPYTKPLLEPCRGIA